ncbi:cob(I)yrinic acid a,c-diamide adenosyltransferase [Parasphingorhabdus sp.]|uniref:cob(I)yrinic acid a,c-diamide adenosyltransferase n=1 Tax=Parasphingorhabdus sp. TaxID=2709688 RepID=UPI002F932BAE
MVKLNKIYTKTGDDGTTGLVGGARVAKNDPRMAAIGDVDELNSALGVAICQLDDAELLKSLQVIQNDLFDLGADLATPADNDDDFAPSEMVLRVTHSQVDRLESEIDAINDGLDPLTSFILPGGNNAAAAIHLARATARRAERTAVSAAQVMAINPQALAYLNRLSDYLFVLGRMLNNGGKADILWVPGASR